MTSTGADIDGRTSTLPSPGEGAPKPIARGGHSHTGDGDGTVKVEKSSLTIPEKKSTDGSEDQETGSLFSAPSDHTKRTLKGRHIQLIGMS